AIGDGVADKSRLEPFEIAEAGRGAELGDRLAADAARVVLAAAMVDQQPHPDAGGMPARGAERAEMRARGGRLVEVERLRIETHGEGLDILGGEGVAADVAALADAGIPGELHRPPPASRPAPAPRPPDIGLTIRDSSGLPAASISSQRNLTKPMSGRLREGRVSSTVARAEMRSPGRSGASHFTSSTPGEPRKSACPMKSSDIMRIRMQ